MEICRDDLNGKTQKLVAGFPPPCRRTGGRRRNPASYRSSLAVWPVLDSSISHATHLLFVFKVYGDSILRAQWNTLAILWSHSPNKTRVHQPCIDRVDKLFHKRGIWAALLIANCVEIGLAISVISPVLMIVPKASISEKVNNLCLALCLDKIKTQFPSFFVIHASISYGCSNSERNLTSHETNQ